MAVSCFLGGRDDGAGSKVGGQCLRGHSKVTVRSDPRQILLNKFLYFFHLLGTGAVREVAEAFEFDQIRVDYAFDQSRRQFAELFRYHRVAVSVALKDRDVLNAT